MGRNYIGERWATPGFKAASKARAKKRARSRLAPARFAFEQRRCAVRGCDKLRAIEHGYGNACGPEHYARLYP